MQLTNPALFRQQAYINGVWLDADSSATIEVTNPANGEVVGHVPDMNAVEAARAIEAARVAMISWRKF
ncbi:MAG: succinate-semialdehyde dehydrogenase/glutarate-semialdehyde dehydrogenase, partial [Oceanospirillaceae bacterium]